MSDQPQQQPRKKVRLGELLISQKLITPAQLSAALAEQKKTGTKLGRTLIDLGYLDEEHLLRALSKFLKIPIVDLKKKAINPSVMRLLPETHARRYRAIVLEDRGNEILVGVSDPLDLMALDELARILRRPVRQAIVRDSELLRSIDVVYRRTEEISSLADALSAEIGRTGFDVSQLEIDAEADDAPVVRLLQSLFEDAVQVNASDIHIEPDDDVLRIRQRIDGVLYEHVMKEKRIAPALVLKLKLMAKLNISERRLPQDGRFNIRVKERSLDVRLSTMPIQNGESVVMRLLDQSQGILDLAQLGMPPRLLKRFNSLIHRPYGLILVTGPTGSGKTTTLYAALSELNEPQKKIITVEDPVEYRLPRINQVQVNPKIDLSFARVLRTALRQDPDVVMVGEIRDGETAEIALRASITGHLVLSTLHTNDAVTSTIRLVDMGAEGFLVGTAVRAVIAQRLVRRVCPVCAAPYDPTPPEQAWLRHMLGDGADQIQLKEGTGCTHCNSSGYRGRLGVYELLEMDQAMSDALRTNDTGAYTRAARTSSGFRSLVETALDNAAEGVTTLAEVLRLAGDFDESAIPEATPEPDEAEPQIEPDGEIPALEE